MWMKKYRYYPECLEDASRDIDLLVSLWWRRIGVERGAF
jgi:hypothetical protein